MKGLTRPARSLALFLATAGCAAGLSHRGPNVTDETAIRNLEQEVAAATERNDAAALEPLMAPDFVFVNPAGRILTREQFLDNMRTGRLRNTSYKSSDMKVRIYGPAAVVTYQSDVAGTSGLQSISARRIRSTMLVKRGGRWLIVAQQSTPVLTLPR
jgi:uncharacterized protein (TIGR02246 family)